MIRHHSLVCRCGIADFIVFSDIKLGQPVFQAGQSGIGFRNQRVFFV